jgi:hypothetical protein
VIYEKIAAIVSFGGMTKEQKREAEILGISCFSWQEFISLVSP